MARVEYYVDNDPGQGAGTSMAPVNGTYQAQVEEQIAGTYVIGVRAMDAAGNWSDVSKDVLSVYDPSGGYVTGHADIAPSASDVLPLSDRGTKPMTLGFSNVKYAGTTTASPSGSVDLSYVVQNNKNEFSLSSTSLSALIVPDAMHATIMGTADLTVYNGSKTPTVTSNPFRIDMALGNGTVPDHFVVKIYASGVNIASATSLYVIDDDAGLSNVRVK